MLLRTITKKLGEGMAGLRPAPEFKLRYYFVIISRKRRTGNISKDEVIYFNLLFAFWCATRICPVD
jgi:hypothetical protein